ncbi:MAG: methyltransferase domain-containing protein [Gammaproteobacteria bacterium]|jgi:ubiquinone/menaquinone biosynthesis C-methylase UbiE
MSDHRAAQERWNRYWEHGFLTSCAGAFSGNYEGTLKSVWERFLAECPQGSRVLDICTGNGAIAMIANEISRIRSLDLEIHAIDSAVIRPLATVRHDRELLEGIRFYSETPAESTPFPDGHFDAITGQYAFEYTSEDGCVAELARITAPGGRLQFVIHHAGSVVIETSREELRNGAIILDETRIFDVARALMERVGATRTAEERRALAADPDAESKRAALNRGAERLSRAAESSPHPELLHLALERISGAYKALGQGAGQALEHLAAGRGEIEANVARLEDLMAAARSPEDLRRIAGSLSAAGFEVREPVELRHDNGPLMGWLLQARLPG